jgi:hypothetical protein
MELLAPDSRIRSARIMAKIVLLNNAPRGHAHANSFPPRVHIRAEIAKWAKVIKESGAEVDD